MSWPTAVLFDLDGTLVDSVPDIHGALNDTLESYGEPPFTLEAVAGMVGQGIHHLIETAWQALDKPLDPASRDRIVERFLAFYHPRATELTTLNAGATGVVLALAGRGVRLGVVTNKLGAETAVILKHFGLDEFMEVVIGGDAGVARKPAPDLILLACRKLGIEPADALFIGDSRFDVKAAKAAGMPVLVLEGGYSTVPAASLGADGVLSRLDELERHLPALDPARNG